MARKKSVEKNRESTLPSLSTETTGTVDVIDSSPREGCEDHTTKIRTSNREELIECIKRGDKATWVPKTTLQALYDHASSFRAHDGTRSELKMDQEEDSHEVEDPFFGVWTEAKDSHRKPRSAFHRGDFNGVEESLSSRSRRTPGWPPTLESISPSETSSVPWLPSTASPPIGHMLPEPRSSQDAAMASVRHRRAPSLGSSLSSSFVHRTPTSPLVHAINNTSLDDNSSNFEGSATDRATRRRTLPPASFHSLGVLPTDARVTTSGRSFSNSPQDSLTQPSHRQTRRSLSSFTYHSASSPQNPRATSQRSSFATEYLPRRRTSMVGSFEESILRGRMSSPASQPFEFVAQIGVMGKGNCPASLKCPPHVTVPFQAVYYHYPSSSQGRSLADDAPSPYVGTIDLESNLKTIHLITKRKRAMPQENVNRSLTDDPRAPENTPIGKALARDQRIKNGIATSPKITLGGAYRVPQQGQIQIIVKNQQKTAVKLFLVPYDLEGMTAGTKTFVRQRSYSQGPIIEGTLDSTAGVASLHDPMKDKHILRYLIHLRFCCPAKGKYYLHDHIRVVFANRVPDGKEKLDSELQLPDPKFSVFRPQQIRQESFHDIFQFPGSRRPQTDLTLRFMEEGQLSEQSKAVPFVLRDPFTSPEQTPANTTLESSAQHSPGDDPRDDTNNAFLQVLEVDGNDQTSFFSNFSGRTSSPTDTFGALAPIQGFLPSTSARASPIPWGTSSTSSTNRSFSPAPVESGDGLLSQQFRILYRTKSPSQPDGPNLVTSLSSTNIQEVQDRLSRRAGESIDQASFGTNEERPELGDL